MMRFRCPHCRHFLEVDKPTDAFLCPACRQWCRIPVPEEFTLEKEEFTEAAEADEPSPLRRDAITDRPADEKAPASQEDDVLDVEFEIIEDGEERQRQRKRRRRRRRSRGMDLRAINLPLILLVVLAPVGLIFVVLAFLVHPMAGMASIFMMGGGIWFTLIAAEDGLVTVLCVMFVPFFALYYAFTNWDRVAIPFLLQLIGSLVFAFSMAMAGRRTSDDRWSAVPVPIVRPAVHSSAGLLTSQKC